MAPAGEGVAAVVEAPAAFDAGFDVDAAPEATLGSAMGRTGSWVWGRFGASSA